MDFSSHRQQLMIADRKLSYLDVGTGLYSCLVTVICGIAPCGRLKLPR